MWSSTSRSSWQRPLLLFIEGVEDGWAVPLLIAGFVAVWMAYLSIAYAGGDLHQDVLETWTLGRSFDWGSSKHPPLMGWIARLWTSLFPLANWSFDLLALTNAAIALLIVDLIARQFVRGDKRLIVLLLLMLLPIYQLHAQRFNANAVLLAAWPLAPFCFLRSFQTRTAGWAAAAGATAALAMLGKYYSIFLIGGFAVAAICHSERRAYFTSHSPWIAAATGLSVLAPHIHWLATTGAQPFAYAMEHHSGKALGPAVHEAAGFVLAIAGIVAIPALIWLRLAGGHVLTNLSRDISAMSSGMKLLSVIGISTVVLPTLTAAMLGTDMPPLWGLQGIFLFVIAIVCSTSYPVPRVLTVNLAATVMGIAMLAAAVVAPVHALYRNTHTLSEGRNFYQGAIAELTRRWHALSDTPLPAVGGDEGLAFAAAFYSPDHPLYDPRLLTANVRPQPAGSRSAQGWTALCYDTDIPCVTALERAVAEEPNVVRSDFVLQSELLGERGASQGFIALLMPPLLEQPEKPSPSRSIAAEFSARRRSRPAVN